MGVLPRIAQNETAVAKISINKAQELPVRTSSIGVLEHESDLKLEKGPELAEKLNEETKKKYIKGGLDYLFKSTVYFLINCR